MSIKELQYNKVIFLSVFGNSLEVSLQHPLNVLKNHKQSKYCKFHYNFKNLYKGYLFNLYSINCISLIQYYGYNVFYKKTNNDLLSSVGSGFISAMIASPAEYYIINKIHKETLLQSIQRNKITNIFKFGLLSCLMREGIYTSCLLTFTPKLEKKMKEKEIKYGNIISPLFGGSISTFLSHPFDTRKTNQQKNNNNKLKFKCDFRGFGLRSIRMITTFFILNETNKFFINNLY
jgi:hypothetical protein